MTHVTCRLTARNRDQLRNRTLGNRAWATFTFLDSKLNGTEMHISTAASPSRTDGSIVFARWRQCAPHLMHVFGAHCASRAQKGVTIGSVVFFSRITLVPITPRSHARFLSWGQILSNAPPISVKESRPHAIHGCFGE